MRDMKKAYGFTLFIILGISSSSFPSFDPAQTFEKKCSSCHTIGGGVLKGPDLKDVKKRREEAWLVKFIQSPDRMIKSGDPIAVKLYNDLGQKEMPDPNLSESEIKELLRFIEAGGIGTVVVNSKSAEKATKDDIEIGKKIYLGKRTLKNGGPACVSCHSVLAYGPFGGGTLAKNLNRTYSDFKDNGISIALTKLAFPVMNEVFAGKKLTDEEIFFVKAFLYHADREQLPTENFQRKFLFLGLILLIILLLLINLTWRYRRKQSVRKDSGGLR